MNKRNTKQKFTLLSYLEENKDKHLSAEKISADLIKYGVSQATVYRILNSLVDEGLVRKIYVDESKSACFQYIDEKCKSNNHYHFICNKCSNVIHFESDKIIELQNDLLKRLNLSLDTNKTVFYGLCSKCSEEK